jgi:replication-associated recombination protein RarA
MDDRVSQMYLQISALQKSVRRGKEEDALYWAYMLHRAGFSKVLTNRLHVILWEDIGVGDMAAVVFCRYALSDFECARDKGQTDFLALNCAILAMCRAIKCRDADNLIPIILNDVVNDPEHPIPDYALDGHTFPGKRMGRGIEFFAEVSAVLEPDHSTQKYKRQFLDIKLWEQRNKMDLGKEYFKDLDAKKALIKTNGSGVTLESF